MVRNRPFHSSSYRRQTRRLGETRRVPGLGDRLDLSQNRVRFDVPEEGGVLQRAAVRVRDRIEARSKRKPSTCISLTQ